MTLAAADAARIALPGRRARPLAQRAPDRLPLEFDRARRSGMSPAGAERDERLVCLLAECARGNQAAFADLYRETSGTLFATALRLLRRRDQAEEVLQDCFISIWNSSGVYLRELSPPRAWMIAIVRNRCLDHLRRPQLEVRLPLNEDGEDPLAAVVSDEPDPLERLRAASDARSVKWCLTRLQPEQRQAVVLAYYEGLSRSELAEHLGRPVGTVKSWIRRGLGRLKACVEELWMERARRM